MQDKKLLLELARSVSDGRNERAGEIIAELIARGTAPVQILNRWLLNGLHIIGEKFRHNEVYVPQVILAADAMRSGLDSLRPLLNGNVLGTSGRVLLATCSGDLHDLGKIIVGIMLEGAGFEVLDLGVDVAADIILKGIHDFQPDIVGLAAGMTTTLAEVKWAVRVLEGAGVRDKFYLMVGGMPVTADFARQVGADGFAADAPAAVNVARQLMLCAGPKPGKGGELITGSKLAEKQ